MLINYDLIPWLRLPESNRNSGSFAEAIYPFTSIFANFCGFYRMRKGDIGWRVVFISGLMRSIIIEELFLVLPPIQIKVSYAKLVLVGFAIVYLRQH
jgi:hypothetical protein